MCSPLVWAKPLTNVEVTPTAVLKDCLLLGMVRTHLIPAFWRWKQAAFFESEAWLVYLASSGPAGPT